MPRGNKLKSGVRSKTSHRTLEQSRSAKNKKWHSDHKADRAARGRDRTAAGLKVGDPREVHHVDPISKGGTAGAKPKKKGAKAPNTVVTSRKANRTKGNKMRKS